LACRVQLEWAVKPQVKKVVPKEGFMNIVENRNAATVAVEADESGGTAELVRGNAETLIERLKPLVRSQSVALDMGAVQRIDAAGIAALITLYCTARQSGHEFTIVNTSPKVEEILLLVGVRQLLASEGEKDHVEYAPCAELSAA
jgi:anti-anti-sigma factor